MSKRAGFSHPDASLHRQSSMTVEGSFNKDRPTRPCSPRIMMNPAVSWYNVGDQSKATNRDGWYSPNPDERTRAADTRQVRDHYEESLRHLEVKDHLRSGRSSALMKCRASQPPSFESFDSSTSAISWTSSADPDTSQVNTPGITQRADVPISETVVEPILTGQLSRHYRVSGPVSVTQPEPGLSGSESTAVKGDGKVCILPEQPSRNGPKMDTTFRKEEVPRYEVKEKPSVKQVGLERDHLEHEKTSQHLSSQTIKGLWKRAFQSMRKDKGKREKSLHEPRATSVGSDEIDPVYHLLRCAASKSQATVTLTTGIGSSKSANQCTTSPVDTPLTTAKPVPYHFMSPTRSVSMRNPRSNVE